MLSYSLLQLRQSAIHLAQLVYQASLTLPELCQISEPPDGYMGATACIIVNSFIDYYENTTDWTALAWWIHDCIDYYNAITFFPKYAAFNIGWSENPECRKLYICSYIFNPYTSKKGYLTRLDAENYSGSHEQFYKEFTTQLAIIL